MEQIDHPRIQVPRIESMAPAEVLVRTARGGSKEVDKGSALSKPPSQLQECGVDQSEARKGSATAVKNRVRRYFRPRGSKGGGDDDDEGGGGTASASLSDSETGAAKADDAHAQKEDDDGLLGAFDAQLSWLADSVTGPKKIQPADDDDDEASASYTSSYQTGGEDEEEEEERKANLTVGSDHTGLSSQDYSQGFGKEAGKPRSTSPFERLQISIARQAALEDGDMAPMMYSLSSPNNKPCTTKRVPFESRRSRSSPPVRRALPEMESNRSRSLDKPLFHRKQSEVSDRKDTNTAEASELFQVQSLRRSRSLGALDANRNPLEQPQLSCGVRRPLAHQEQPKTIVTPVDLVGSDKGSNLAAGLLIDDRDAADDRNSVEASSYPSTNGEDFSSYRDSGSGGDSITDDYDHTDEEADDVHGDREYPGAIERFLSAVEAILPSASSHSLDGSSASESTRTRHSMSVDSTWTAHTGPSRSTVGSTISGRSSMQPPAIVKQALTSSGMESNNANSSLSRLARIKSHSDKTKQFLTDTRSVPDTIASKQSPQSTKRRLLSPDGSLSTASMRTPRSANDSSDALVTASSSNQRGRQPNLPPSNSPRATVPDEMSVAGSRLLLRREVSEYFANGDSVHYTERVFACGRIFREYRSVVDTAPELPDLD